MEWIQLLLPQEGMQEALLRCLTGCSLGGCHLDREDGMRRSAFRARSAGCIWR